MATESTENTEYSEIISVSSVFSVDSVDSVAIYHDFDLSKCHSSLTPRIREEYTDPRNIQDPARS